MVAKKQLEGIGFCIDRHVATCEASTRVEDVLQRLPAEPSTWMPIGVQAAGELVGVVSRETMTDLLLDLLTEHRTDAVLRDVMTAVPRVSEDDDVIHALGVLRASKAPLLAVTKQDGGLLGLVQRTDLIRAANQNWAQSLRERIFARTTGGQFVRGALFGASLAIAIVRALHG